MAARVSLEEFCQQLGPFTLIRRDNLFSDAAFDSFGLPMNVAVTTPAKKEDVAKGSLALLFSIDDLAVTILPTLQTEDELVVGRQADCDLVIDDPSVSKLHARLHWDSARGMCTLKDLESTNGTLLNGSATVKKELTLRDGDIISFGHAHFWYLLTQTLHACLAQARSADLIGSRSG